MKTLNDRVFVGVSLRLSPQEEKRLERLARRLNVRRGQAAREAFERGLEVLEEKGADHGAQ